MTSRRRDFTSNPIYIVWSVPETNALNSCRGNLGAVSQADQLAFVGQASSASPRAVIVTLAGHLGHSWLASMVPHTGAPQQLCHRRGGAVKHLGRALSIETREQRRLAMEQALAGKFIAWVGIFFTECMTGLFLPFFFFLTSVVCCYRNVKA